MDHVLRQIAIVEKVVAYRDRFFQTPHVVQQVRLNKQRISWLHNAFMGFHVIEEGKSLEIRLFRIDLSAVQKIRILW